MTSKRSVFDQSTSNTTSNLSPEDLNPSNKTSLRDKTFSILMKLVQGSIFGAVHYDNVYNELDNENDEDETNIVHGTDVPSLSSIARKAARNEGKQLDEKQ